MVILNDDISSAGRRARLPFPLIPAKSISLPAGREGEGDSSLRAKNESARRCGAKKEVQAAREDRTKERERKNEKRARLDPRRDSLRKIEREGCRLKLKGKCTRVSHIFFSINWYTLCKINGDSILIYFLQLEREKSKLQAPETTKPPSPGRSYTGCYKITFARNEFLKLDNL
ncbi:hypothetical protein PUN28_006580 [Cardiocondyla obscurior]|uniref:Uncharacterized protein n=1 Tax=Cardiocondyla obscurior TaxID=286306 RepID=A0AAW2GEH7_9HYME